MGCNCWVSKATAEERFGIRYGAHATDCPTYRERYRESQDPVDRAMDEELRKHRIKLIVSI